VAVPKSAAVVVSLNARQIVEKAGLDNLNQFKTYALLKRVLDNDADRSTKIIKDLLEDTRRSGLNLDHIFVYLFPGDDCASISCGITFLMDDAKAFERLLKEDLRLEVDEVNKTVVIDDGLILRWNGEMAVVSVNAEDKGVNFFNREESESIVADALFLGEYSGHDDVHVYLKYDELMESFNDIYYSGYLAKQIDWYKDLSLSATFNAEKGAFVATGKMLPEEKAGRLFKIFYKTDFNDELYRYFPDKSLLAFKIAVKPVDIYREYLDVFSEYDKYLDATGDRRHMDIQLYDGKIASICSYFTGEVLGNLAGINFSNNPDFAVAAGVVDGKENEVTALLEEVGMTKNRAGYYSIAGGFTLYCAVNKNIAFLTSNAESIERFMESGYTPDITSAKDFGKELKAAIAYSYINLNINDYPPIVKPGLASLSRNMGAFIPLIEKLKSINFSATSTSSFECKLKITDSGYASKALVKTLDELLAANMDIFF
jgi:hypothetical protein